ncbi:MAG: AAA family ATPase [Candidatus Hydrogenedentales bacterium]|jgi:energy-coupling factor transporter ATP-binding protein EcfA2
MSLRLEDNRLILVGENGTGKSTLVNMMYYCLTGQWARLIELPFQKLRAVFDSILIEVDRDKLQRELLAAPGDVEMLHFLRRRYGAATAERMHRELMHSERSHADQDGQLHLSHEFGLEAQLWREFVRRGAQSRSSYIPNLESALKKVSLHQVLFLPTYRRIERDLQAIFPQMRAERDLKTFHRATPTDAAYIELVEFGMRDVADVIRATMQGLDRDFRQDLVRLTSLYLRDVIRGDYNHDQFGALLSDATADAIPALLTRVDDKILPGDDRRSLSELIGRIQQSGRVPPESRVAAHFLVRLVEAHALQSKREAPVRAFAEVCNGYLSEKQIVFDSAQFELFVCRTGEDSQPLLDQRIPVDGLSSGEKQIVSLFAHMYLSGRNRYYVIIDEPELSISVVWQRKFLEDIINTGMCAGLVAVTHSPFIFENSLSRYAHSIAEFASSRAV